MLEKDGRAELLDSRTGWTVRKCIFMRNQKDVLVIKGMVDENPDCGKPVFWQGTDLLYIYSSYVNPIAVHLTSRGYYCLSTAWNRDFRLSGLSTRDFPAEYLLRSYAASTVVDGKLYVGFSLKGDGRAMLWHDGSLDTLGFNGYVTTLSSMTQGH